MSSLPFGCVFSFDGLSIPERMSQNPHIFYESGKFFDRPGDILAPVLALLNNIDRNQGKGNDDGPYTVAYESPFTAGYACSHCAADLPPDRDRGVFRRCRSSDAYYFRVPCVYPYPSPLE